MKLIVLDNGLIGKGEHSYALAKKLREVTTRRQLHCRIFGCEVMDRSIAVEIGAVPHFRGALYDWAPPTAHEIRLRSLKALFRGDPREAMEPSERETWKTLNATFEQDLHALPADIWSADNLIVAPALTQNQLFGLVRTLLARRRDELPRVICQSMFPPSWVTWGRKSALGGRFYRKAFRLARPLIGKILFFTTENEALAALYRERYGIDAKILPVPFGEGQKVSASDGPPRVGYFGYSKREKGFHLLPRAIGLCRQSCPDIEFIVQIQHDPILFGLRGSGIYTESVAAGRPVVASAGTFAARCIESGAAEGEVFAPYDAAALAAAIMRLTPRLAERKARAAERATAFARAHNADVYVDVLLAHMRRDIRAAESGADARRDGLSRIPLAPSRMRVQTSVEPSSSEP